MAAEASSHFCQPALVNGNNAESHYWLFALTDLISLPLCVERKHVVRTILRLRGNVISFDLQNGSVRQLPVDPDTTSSVP